jgi:hypothetical protein
VLAGCALVGMHVPRHALRGIGQPGGAPRFINASAFFDLN